MWYQIHEMLRVEKGGEIQIAEEVEAYNPLIPNGNEPVATLMFEIDDAEERTRILAGLDGVEHSMIIEIEGKETIFAVPEDNAERTRDDGKESAVQFVHFPLPRARYWRKILTAGRAGR